MNNKTERKLLREFLKIIDDPAGAEKRFKRYAQVAFTIFMLIIFYLLSENAGEALLSIGLGVVAGLALGLGIWFLQASMQTGLMVDHISKDSITSRLSEIGDP